MSLFDEQTRTCLERILSAPEDRFDRLLEIAGLDPERELRFADLREVDFGGSILVRWDLTGADLRGASFHGAHVNQCIFDRAIGLDLSGAIIPTEAITTDDSHSKLSQRELHAAALAAGVTMIAPETVVLAADTQLGSDVIIEPHVVFGPGVVIEENVTIRAFSQLEGTYVSKGATVGPFARLRPGTRIGNSARVGNFVEVKNAALGAHTTVNRLSYIGDASIGDSVQIGGGAITCNYDGFSKHRTAIRTSAFIEPRSALVAPLNVGEGAHVGAGSVITHDVPSDALALSREPQVVQEQAAAWRRQGRRKNT